MDQHHAHPAPIRRSAWLGRVVAGTAIVLTLALSACGSPSPTPAAGGTTSAPSGSPTAAPPTPPPSTRPSGPAGTAACSARAILAALPGGATMRHYDCAETAGTEWAAARVEPGDTVFFLRWEGGRWQAEESSDVCGTASAGLPPALLDYCAPVRTPSSRATRTSAPRPTGAPNTPVRPDAADCTARAVLAALPGGSTMQRFSCAEVGGTEWAAARVDPGSTVFFLRWQGGRWQAEQSSDVCGTASAGLPESLERYCR